MRPIFEKRSFDPISKRPSEGSGIGVSAAPIM
jgi:hypothetical protein